jgi:hypothetical protein
MAELGQPRQLRTRRPTRRSRARDARRRKPSKLSIDLDSQTPCRSEIDTICREIACLACWRVSVADYRFDLAIDNQCRVRCLLSAANSSRWDCDNVVMSAGVTVELPPDWLSAITDAVSRRIVELERWVTVDGLAQWLGCSPEHIYDLRQRGLPARRLLDERGRGSKKLYFSIREVASWLEEESIVV